MVELWNLYDARYNGPDGLTWPDAQYLTQETGTVEFFSFDEAAEALRSVGVVAELPDEDHLKLRCSVESNGDAHHLHMAEPACGVDAQEGATRVEISRDKLPDAVEAIVGVLHLSQLLIYPVGKWRSVFDAVAFSLAANEDWQQVDAMATVRLNTRDPLLCEPGDYHTMHNLIAALFSDAESVDQGVSLTSTAKPFIAEIVPEGAIRVTVGSQVLADELVEHLKL